MDWYREAEFEFQLCHFATWGNLLTHQSTCFLICTLTAVEKQKIKFGNV